MKPQIQLSVIVLVAILALVPNVNATGYMDGSNWTGLQSIMGIKYVGNGGYATIQDAINAGGHNILITDSISESGIVPLNNSVIWGGRNVVVTASGNSAIFNVSGKQNITFYGFTINGKYPTYNTAGIYSLGGASGIDVYNMNFIDVSSNSVQIIGSNNSVHNNKFLMTSPSYTTDTVAVYLGITEVLYNVGDRSYNNKIKDNDIYNYYGDGIACNIAQCDITGNYIDGYSRHTSLASGIDLYGLVTGSIISKNTIKNLNMGNRTPGIMLNIDTNNNMPSGNIIEGNIVDNAGCAGIELNGASVVGVLHTSNNNTVSNNIISNTNVSGCLNGADITIAFTNDTSVFGNNLGSATKIYDAGTSTRLSKYDNKGITNTDSVHIGAQNELIADGNVNINASGDYIWQWGTNGNWGLIMSSARIGSSDAIEINTNTKILYPAQLTTASYSRGGLFFNSTLNKTMIGGATGWETVQSNPVASGNMLFTNGSNNLAVGYNTTAYMLNSSIITQLRGRSDQGACTMNITVTNADTSAYIGSMWLNNQLSNSTILSISLAPDIDLKYEVASNTDCKQVRLTQIWTTTS